MLQFILRLVERTNLVRPITSQLGTNFFLRIVSWKFLQFDMKTQVGRVQ